MRGGNVIGGFTVGEELAIVGNYVIWRTPRAIEMLGSWHFGLDDDYVPIEELQNRKTEHQP